MITKSPQYPYRNINITSNTSDGNPFFDFIAYKCELAEIVEDKFVRNIETIFFDHSKHLSVLELSDINYRFAANMLNKCKNLKELKLDSVNEKHFKNHFYSQDFRTPDIIMLNNLKFLEVKSSKEIFSRIEAPRVETLIIHDDPGHDVVRSFLEISWDLKILELYNFNLRSVRRAENFRFRLEKLTFKLQNNLNLFRSLINNRLNFEAIMQRIRVNFRDNELQMRNPEGRNVDYIEYVEQFRHEIQRNQQEFLGNSLLNFLTPHKDTLKELNVNFDGLNLQANRIMDTIFTDFNLTKLSIKSNQKSLNFSIPKVSNSIEFLEVDGFMTFEDIRELISKCPAVTKLKVNLENTISSNILSIISSSMSNLKTFEVNSFFTEISEGIILEKVEKLKILKLNIWHKIAQTCPNVTKLTLIDDNFELVPEDLLKVLKNLKKLENLEIVGKTKFLNLEDICSLFLNQGFNVKTVKLFGPIYKDAFYKKIETVTKGTKTQISVLKF